MDSLGWFFLNPGPFKAKAPWPRIYVHLFLGKGDESYRSLSQSMKSAAQSAAHPTASRGPAAVKKEESLLMPPLEADD
jgi:hypothetical protein